MRQEKQTIVIFNPKAGLGIIPAPLRLQEIKNLLKKYDIDADFKTTSFPSNAKNLALESASKGYGMVICVGGDGTTEAVANGLVGTSTIMGIIPKGTFMNIAKTLKIPRDTDDAIRLIKNGKPIKVDIGKVTAMSGKNKRNPFYFVEQIGIGFEAELMRDALRIEKMDFAAFGEAISHIINLPPFKATIIFDKKEVIEHARMIIVSNCPISLANIRFSPTAKINDHLVDITVFDMAEDEIVRYLYDMTFGSGKSELAPKIFKAKSFKIKTIPQKTVQADASLFGKTPVEANLVSNGISIISGLKR